MRQYLLRLIDRMDLALNRECEVARCGKIVVSDIDKRRTRFRDCILAALELVSSCDPLRYRRLHRRLAWIVNRPLDGAGGGEYEHRTRTCVIDFDEQAYDSDPEYWVAWYASMLVHEATHGAIDARGIGYTPELRSRIERLCVAEQQRFIRRLAEFQPELARHLDRDFTESDWHWSWNAGGTAKRFRRLRRVFSKLCRPAPRSPRPG